MKEIYGIISGMEEVYKKTVNENGIYSCNEIDISVEEWKSVLQNEKIKNSTKFFLACFYQEPDHEASCKLISEKYKCSAQTPNSIISSFGKGGE